MSQAPPELPSPSETVNAQGGKKHLHDAVLNFSQLELQAKSDHMLRGMVKKNQKQPKTNPPTNLGHPWIWHLLFTYHVQSYELANLY